MSVCVVFGTSRVVRADVPWVNVRWGVWLCVLSLFAAYEHVSSIGIVVMCVVLILVLEPVVLVSPF